MGLCEMSSYLVQSSKIIIWVFSMYLSFVFVLYMYCSNSNLNVGFKAVGSKAVHVTSCHLK